MQHAVGEQFHQVPEYAARGFGAVRDKLVGVEAEVGDVVAKGAQAEA